MILLSLEMSNFPLKNAKCMKSILSVMEFMFAGTVHCLNMKGKGPSKKLQLAI